MKFKLRYIVIVLVIMGFTLQVNLASAEETNVSTNVEASATVKPREGMPGMPGKIVPPNPLKERALRMNAEMHASTSMMVGERKEIRDERKGEIKDIRASTTMMMREMRMNNKEERKNLSASTTEVRRDIREERTELFKKLSTEKKDVLKNMKKEEFEVRKNALVKQLTLSLENLANIRARIDARITELEASGKVMTDAKTSLSLADDKIAKAKVAVNALAALTAPISNGAAVGSANAEVALSKPRQVGDAAIKAVKEARDALKEVIKLINPERPPETSPTPSTTPETTN